MNLLDRMIAAVAPEAAVKRQTARVRLAGLTKARSFYEGASRSYRTSHWRPVNTDANSEIRTGGERLRNVSRDLVRNNAFASRAVSVITTNVIGSGIIPSADTEAVRLKRELEAMLVDHFDSTACDVTGQATLYGIQSLALRTVIESGEVLIRLRRARASDNLPLPFQLQVLEPDYLNHLIDGDLKGNEVGKDNFAIQGIEFDRRGKIVAYHLFQQHPGSTIPQSQVYDSERVPADEIIHLFKRDRPGQVRGASWFAPVIFRLHDFKDFVDAQLKRQQIAACFAAFVTNEGGETLQINDDESSDSDQPLEYFEPGFIERLRPGESVEFANPPSTADFGTFSRVTLHEIAAGLGLSYEALTGDLSGVNFSSGRMGWLEFQRQIDDWRDNMILPMMLQPISRWFMQAATIKLGSIPNTKARILWTAPKREMISPRDEVPFAIEQVRAGLMSRSEYLRRAGYDPEVVEQEMAEDNRRADRLGLILDSDARHTKLVGGTAAGASRTASSEDVAPAPEE